VGGSEGCAGTATRPPRSRGGRRAWRDAVPDPWRGQSRGGGERGVPDGGRVLHPETEPASFCRGHRRVVESHLESRLSDSVGRAWRPPVPRPCRTLFA